MPNPPSVYVLGSEGLIGRALTTALTRRSVDLTCVSRVFSTAPAPAKQMIGNVDDPDLLSVISVQADYVIDLVSHNPDFVRNLNSPTAEERANHEASIRIKTIAAGRPKRILIASSGGQIYGQDQLSPRKESGPYAPSSAYGRMKLELESLAISATRGTKSEVVIARPGNVYGPMQIFSRRRGLVGVAVRKMLLGRPLTLTGPPEAMHDYVHVVDVAEGMIAMLHDGEANEAYNIGTGIGTTSEEVVSLVRAAVGRASPESHLRSLPGDMSPDRVDSGALDCTKLTKASGWVPRVTLDEGIESVVEFGLSCINPVAGSL